MALGLDVPPMLLSLADDVIEYALLLHCVSPVVADFVAKVFLHS